MEKKNKIGLWIILVILILAVAGLSWYAGVKYSESKHKDDDTVEKRSKKKTENVPEEEAKLKDEIVPDTWYIKDLSKIGKIQDGLTDLFDKDGYIKDDYYNIEELKGQKFKAYYDLFVNDVGGNPYYFLTTDGRVYEFSAMCNTIDYREEEDMEECVTEVKLKKKVDDIKTYAPYNSEFSATQLLYYCGNEIYNYNWEKFDPNNYIIFRDDGDKGSLISDNKGNLVYETTEGKKEKLLDPDTKEEVHFKYVVMIGDFDLRSYYLIADDDYMYYYQPGEGSYDAGYGFHKMSKVVDYKFEDSYTLEGTTYECGFSICNMTVKVEKGNTFHFYG